jgi:hydroxyacylglutathione hydrolase
MLSVLALPAFTDNYIWLIHNQHVALVVDPGDHQPVVQAIDRLGLKLLAVLNTHHHADHVGGNQALYQRYGCTIYGPATEPIPALTHALGENDEISFPDLTLSFQIISTPGHTLGHIAYYGAGNLFCGDTLFGCGCGRLFEGSPEQMHRSLSRLAQLPDNTLVCCAHEYTLSNIVFAKSVDGGNPALLLREQGDLHKREQGLPTLPSTLELEKATNPFLRCHEASLARAAESLSGHKPLNEVEIFAALRTAKDRFRA